MLGNTGSTPMDLLRPRMYSANVALSTQTGQFAFAFLPLLHRSLSPWNPPGVFAGTPGTTPLP